MVAGPAQDSSWQISILALLKKITEYFPLTGAGCGAPIFLRPRRLSSAPIGRAGPGGGGGVAEISDKMREYWTHWSAHAIVSGEEGLVRAIIMYK